MRNIHFSDGYAVAGGAIAATGYSTVAFNRTSFADNRAEGNGGAVYVSDGSGADFGIRTSFSDNVATGDGGAVYVSHDSSISWTKEIVFLNNTVGSDGGALCVRDGSSLISTGESSFIENIAHLGDALFSQGSIVSWNAKAKFTENYASWGGAVGIGIHRFLG